MDFDDYEDEERQHQQASSSNHQNISSYLAKRAKHDYQILEPTELQKEMEDLAAECSTVIGLDPSHCKILLSQYKWDKSVLLERYFEATDIKKFQLNAGIITSDTNSISTRSRTRNKTGLCQICLDKGQLLGLACAHLFCTECWTNYLQQAVLADGRIIVQCPADQCTVAVDEDFVRARLKVKGDDKALEKLARIQLNSFVEGNPLIKWCPAANCEHAVKVQLPEARPIKCKCTYNFCFHCTQPWHAPIGCGLLKFWLKQCSDDSETYNWINAFTKDCPKCKTAIEKNGGCNHMTCRATACKFEFCWVCMGDWKSHNGNYSCNRFTEDAKNKEQQADQSRTALKRYLHYYDRYRNHENSLKLENKLYENIKTKTSQFLSHKFSFVETDFLRHAVDALCECRRTLMYTYAFAFYLQQDNCQTRIFEDNQQNLEVATEQLSEYLERDLNEEEQKDFVSLRQKVQDTTTYVQNRRNKMLQHCVEGAERGQWCYNRKDKDMDPKDGTVMNIY